jgi:glycosyltransferase involved in cell wall biosynthesis
MDDEKIMRKNIWIFHHYATPPMLNGLSRPYEFAVKLKQNRYRTSIFAASYLHFSDVNLIKDKSKYLKDDDSGIPFIFLNTPSSAKNTIARVKNMASYYFGLFAVAKKYAKETGKPDIIIASSPHPLAMIAGIKVAKTFNIPCVCEVRDLWPEAIFAFGKLTEKSMLGKLLTAGEHWIYKKADAVIFLKEGDINYIKEKGWDSKQGGDIDLEKCYYINNGVDLEGYKRRISENVLNDTDLHSGKFNVVYTGAIRPVNNVGNILDCAAFLKEYPDIQFLIYGEGNELNDLKQRVCDEGLANVKIKGYVDKKYIPYVLSRSSVNILNYSQSKYNWTRGNSSNKLFEYLAAAKPIISTVKMGYCILEKYNCGLSLDYSTPEELAMTILNVYNMPQSQYAQMCENAYTGAENFDYRLLTDKLVNVIEKVCK